MASLPTLQLDYEHVQHPDTSLQEHFDFFRFFAGNHDPLKREGLYHRIVHSPARDEFCLQVVSYYRIQRFPYHVNDYHPLFVYFDRSMSPVRLLYDSYHHMASQLVPTDRKQIITIQYPWHSFYAGRKPLSRPLATYCFALTDHILEEWWLQPGKPQFKLRTKFVDPWHSSLLSSTATQPSSFRDEVRCPVCGEVTLLDTMELQDYTFRLEVTCPNRHKYVVRYDPAGMKMESSL